MFRKNESHLQKDLWSGLNELPGKLRERLENSWAGTFYELVFVKIDESICEVLYSDKASRPNIAVNILVGLSFLKNGYGWSDEEMYDHYCYDIQVRYALGLRELGAGGFDLRTMYEFRARLSRHMQETGADLVGQIFAQVTDEQVQQLGLKSSHLRTDSTQISSNIRELSRLQLLVEVVQRVYRGLSEADQAKWASEFEPYLKGSSGQYLYRLKGAGASQTHLEAIGQLMAQLVEQLAPVYSQSDSYALLWRVFDEHFQVEAAQVHPKPGEAISPQSLQSPDDWEATFRSKGGEGHTGYVANVTETCHPDNDFQVILHTQTQPNTTDDAQMLADEISSLVERTTVEKMFSDGNYGSPEVDALMSQHQIELHQSAIRGPQPRPAAFNLAACQLEFAPDQPPQLSAVTAPSGERIVVQSGRKDDRFILRFQQDPLAEAYDPTAPPAPVTHYLSQHQIDVAVRRQRAALLHQADTNPRAAVEATVYAIKRPFGNDKLPVRGRFRVGLAIIGSAAMVNLRRMHRFRTDQRQKLAKAAKTQAQNASDFSLPYFLTHCFGIFRPLFGFLRCSCSQRT